MSGYIPNLPTPNQTIAASQPLINRNFTVLETAFTVDHTPLENTTYQGEHNKVTLTTRTAPTFVVDPPASPDGPILYSKVASNALNEMFFESTGGTIVQMSNLANPVTVASGGSTFLPGGLILKWGSVTGKPAGTPFTFNAISGSNFPNSCFSMTLGIFNNGSTTASFTALGKTGATIFSSNVNAVYYMAIGN